jgi:uncharacterized protein (DUF58 family)
LPGEGGECSLRTLHFRMTPTGGLLLIGLFIVLMASIRYHLNGGYLLVFTAAAITVGSIFSLYRNLRGLHVRGVPPRPVWAGDRLSFEIIIERKRSPRLARLGLEILGGVEPLAFDVDAADGGDLRKFIEISTRRRGEVVLPPLRLRTLYPLGLFVAEARWQPSLRGLAYPKPEERAPALPPVRGDRASVEEALDVGPSGANFSGLRPYRPGDRRQRVAWVVYAKSDGQSLAVRDFSGADGELMLTSRLAAPAGDDEAVISRLAAWALQAEQAGIPYGLTLDSVRVSPRLGREHCGECLTHLALVPRLSA